MTRAQQTCLLYLETVAVDYDGLVEAIRMNEDDMKAATDFVDAGLIAFGRIPGAILRPSLTRVSTHWVTFTPAGWALAHQLRIERAGRGIQRAYRAEIDAWVAERQRLYAESGRAEGA